MNQNFLKLNIENVMIKSKNADIILLGLLKLTSVYKLNGKKNCTKLITIVDKIHLAAKQIGENTPKSVVRGILGGRETKNRD